MKKYQFNYQKLKGKMVEEKQNQEKLANKLGIAKTTLNFKLNNKIAFKQDEIVELIKVLKIPKEEVWNYFFTVNV